MRCSIDTSITIPSLYLKRDERNSIFEEKKRFGRRRRRRKAVRRAMRGRLRNFHGIRGRQPGTCSRCNDNAWAVPLIDTWVGGWRRAGGGGGGGASWCTESRDISHYAFLSGGRHYFTYCRRRRTDCLCQFFHPAKKERPAIWSRSTRIAVRTPPQRCSLEFNRIRSPSAIKKGNLFEEVKEDTRICVCLCVCVEQRDGLVEHNGGN